MMPAHVRPARLKKREEWHIPAPLTQEKVPTDTCSSNTYPKINQCITFTYGLGAFQTTASIPGLRKSAVSVSYSTLALSDISLTGFQSQM